MKTVDSYLDLFRKKIKDNRLKQSFQRETIVKYFYEKGEHVDVEGLYSELKEIHPSMGHTTIYRTLKLLCELKMARAHTFLLKNTTYFEPIVDLNEHHDHIICTICNNIVEFYDEEIERLQIEVAKKFKFKMQDHDMQIYGICDNCKDKDIDSEE